MTEPHEITIETLSPSAQRNLTLLTDDSLDSEEITQRYPSVPCVAPTSIRRYDPNSETHHDIPPPGFRAWAYRVSHALPPNSAVILASAVLVALGCGLSWWQSAALAMPLGLAMFARGAR